VARRLVVQVVDDLDGTEVSDGHVEEVFFSLDGSDYQIELRPDNAEKLRRDFSKWIHVAQRLDDVVDRSVRKVSFTSVSGPARQDLRVIRQWAAENGIPVSARGRIPAAVLAAYADAHLVDAETPRPATAPARRSIAG
jgi:hypothetical protein